ncbi:hypothetical protein KIM372_03320 [Bombiscardovia nodaiensis]|uniref:ATP-dependent helicase Rep n=1 Tax=Bombiscardovia nodaiensis TaxID=2932181 RepID=A0ABN6S875_9BIFI|nr:hypothetical protein KIM372_03320 [Bombiscardovia nodaiensis]
MTSSHSTTPATTEGKPSNPHSSQSRGWMLTIPEQPTKPDPDNPLGPRLPDGDPRTEQDLVTAFGNWPWCGQIEQGDETGYRHFQLWMETPSPKRFTTVKTRLAQAGMSDAHIEARWGTKAQAFAYVTKDNTRVKGPFMHGLSEADALSQPGARTDLAALQEAVDSGMNYRQILGDRELAAYAAHCTNWLHQIIEARRFALYGTTDREVEVHYLVGPSGCGKTSSLRAYYPSEDIYRVSEYVRDPFESYDGQKVLILDEFAGQLSLDILLNICDRYPLQLPARYANHIACFDTVWLVSNVKPNSLYTSDDIARRDALNRRIGPFITLETFFGYVESEHTNFLMIAANKGQTPTEAEAAWNTLHPYQGTQTRLAEHMRKLDPDYKPEPETDLTNLIDTDTTL